MNLKLCAKWIDDCQGKKDYDGDILSISTRYWPRGGGFWEIHVSENGATEIPPDMSIKPAAHSSLLLRHGKPGYYESITLTEKNFEGDTFAEVAIQVEKWAQQQMDKAATALLAAFEGYNKHDN